MKLSSNLGSMLALDLDSTMIFTKRSSGCTSREELQEHKLVETRKNKPLSYMTHVAHETLRELSNQAMFVPVTARRYDQVQRIQFPTNPSVLVCLGGAKIIIDGVEDTSWRKSLVRDIPNHAISLNAMESLLSPFQENGWFVKSDVYEGLYKVYLVNKKVAPNNFLEVIRETLNDTGYVTSFAGRKLEIYPKNITKALGLEALIERIGFSGNIYGAGDTVRDVSLLEYSNYSFAPSHHLIDSGIPKNCYITKSSGIEAGEEILLKIKQMI